MKPPPSVKVSFKYIYFLNLIKERVNHFNQVYNDIFHRSRALKAGLLHEKGLKKIFTFSSNFYKIPLPGATRDICKKFKALESFSHKFCLLTFQYHIISHSLYVNSLVYSFSIFKQPFQLCPLKFTFPYVLLLLTVLLYLVIQKCENFMNSYNFSLN